MKNFTDNSYKENDIDFFSVIKRRKKTIFYATLVGLIASLLLVNIIKPIYRAEAILAFEDTAARVGKVNVKTTTDVFSEVEAIKSKAIAQSVIKNLNLKNHQNPTQKNKIKFLNSTSDNSERDIEDFLNKVSVETIESSNVLKVQYSSKNAKHSSVVTNQIVNAYLEYRRKNDTAYLQKITSWLDKRYNILQEKLKISENKLRKFKENNNISQGDDIKLTEQQLSKLEADLLRKKLELVTIQEKLFLVEDAYEKGDRIEINDTSIAYNVLRQFKNKEAEIVLKIAKLSLRYGLKHPKMIGAKKEHKKIKNLIRAEMNLIEKSLKTKASLVSSQVSEIENTLRGYNSSNFSDNKIANRLKVLKEGIVNDKLTFNEFLKVYKTVDIPANIYKSNVRVISLSTPPNTPINFPKGLIVFLITSFCAFFALIFVLFSEKLDRNYKTVSQLEAKTGLKCFGLFPLVKNLEENQSIADFVLNKPGSNVAESVRGIRMNLHLAHNDPDKKATVVTITSSLPDEGKTTLSSSMARLSAKSGEKVILIDCDLRRPKLHQAFGQKPKKTLVEYLTGKATLDDIIFKDKISGANVIFARAVPSTALDLLSKDRMKNLIGFLRQNYQLVLLDSAALLAASDAKFLSSLSDQVIYNVAWNETSREVVNTGLKQFADIDANELALILTKVDIKRQSFYDGAVQYYNRNTKYYSD